MRECHFVIDGFEAELKYCATGLVQTMSELGKIKQ